YPHAIYPEPGGIFPWAFTDNGGRLFWRTKGRPTSWKTVYYPCRGPNFEVFNQSCTAILLGVVTGELRIFAGPFSDYEAIHGSPYDFAQAGAFVPTKPKRKRGTSK